jgi:hypothetical protein
MFALTSLRKFYLSLLRRTELTGDIKTLLIWSFRKLPHDILHDRYLIVLWVHPFFTDIVGISATFGE